MIIDRIFLLNFKNIEEADLSFSPKMNCLFGNNGMGKTNLLDALYYLSFTKNHTNLLDSQLIKHDCDFCVLQGFYRENETLAEEVYCGIKRKQKKVFKRNKKEYERLSEHIGLIPLVMISPSDINLIQGGSDERRKFADMLICQCDKEYLHALIRYNKALQQRNFLLRENQTADRSLFEILEEQLVSEGEIIYGKRKEFVAALIPVFQKYYRIISNEAEEVDLQYDSQLNHVSFAQLLPEKREKDKLLGYTSAGIHKDDFHFMLENYLIRKTGSQGQNKTYLIALKLAQFNFLVQKGSALPILLLDDIFDKLDADRVKQIIRLVLQPEFGQLFITDTNRKYPDEILKGLEHDYKLFQVKEGIISELK